MKLNEIEFKSDYHLFARLIGNSNAGIIYNSNISSNAYDWS